jgi:hypothetical protein
MQSVSPGGRIQGHEHQLDEGGVRNNIASRHSCIPPISEERCLFQIRTARLKILPGISDRVETVIH